ncbi:hypothetical protein ACLKA7_008156 [Drosophila subpalustris]
MIQQLLLLLYLLTMDIRSIYGSCSVTRIIMRVPREHDIGLMFDLTVSNRKAEKAEVLDFTVSSEGICTLNTTNGEQVLAGSIFGGDFGSIEPGSSITVSLVWPTVSLYNRVGSCPIVVSSVNHRNEVNRTQQILYFDTRFETLDSNNHSLRRRKDFVDCKNWDKNYFRNCTPLNCEELYFGKRSYYNRTTEQCEAVPACIGDGIQYDFYANECVDTNNFITDEEIEQLKQGKFDNNYMELHEYGTSQKSFYYDWYFPLNADKDSESESEKESTNANTIFSNERPSSGSGSMWNRLGDLRVVQGISLILEMLLILLLVIIFQILCTAVTYVVVCLSLLGLMELIATMKPYTVSSAHIDELLFRNFQQIKNLKFDDEKVSTISSREQQKTEDSVEKCFDRFEQTQFLNPRVTQLNRIEHHKYLDSMLRALPSHYQCLDSSRPWCVYWILQSAQLLSLTFDEQTLNGVVQFLTKCRAPTGGFGGGPGQYAHLAPTYAAVNSLCIIGTKEAYSAIDRDSLIKFLFSVRDADGSFRLHVDGETDVRGAYCAISCAKLVNIPDPLLKELFAGSGDWIASCQTYEGGFGGAPDLEAHGGYTFCGIASLALLNEADKCDKKALLQWTLRRQMSYEGGFQGRTNKLVDGCYSFWVGATIPITQATLVGTDKSMEQTFFDIEALQEYILLCCQKANGGLIDKPGKPQDLYHTCYTLSGVSIAQHSESAQNPQVLGDMINELLPTHPLFNIPPNHKHLKRKTPDGGIDRREYIGHLVDEYYTSTNVEALEQVTANLANFAYDPINWPHLHEADALDVFVASVDTQNQNLQLHAIAALCNFCLDRNAAKFIIDNITIIRRLFLHSEHSGIVLHSLALHYQLLSAGLANKQLLISPEFLKRVQHWRSESNDARIVKLCQLCKQAQSKLQQVQVIKRFTQHDLETFAQFTGDYNYIHTKDIPVEERRVHGALLNAVVAGIIGTRLPGPGTVVLEQNFKFLKPCRIETDTVVTVRLLNSRKISTVEYECRQNDDVVFAGSAKLLTRSY